MNRRTEHDTREHLLITGEQLCLQKGFTGMGLSELLRTAGVPKGSFYHYFRSKEAFGVAMLEHHYAGYNHQLAQLFNHGAGNYRDRLQTYFQQALSQFCNSGAISGCLTVKLSAEVCDLSEDMRGALEQGTSRVVALIATALEQGRQEQSINFVGDAPALARTLYALWLGANLQAKILRAPAPLESALAHVNRILAAPASASAPDAA
ncbi:TetR/AcrR family transcriptional regulator [Entomohabitans teleogrylli]|uniref:TetR/AcrR family transcriptional regulator n=1 Tax=Entomohabitans teleogrylli TaxID=1384589 RepID=UPI00073D2B3C|nr:TetR/AcrR family transcriptional regulator [Entomohabitans teleogrylli]